MRGHETVLRCRMEWHSGSAVAADLGITKGQLNGDWHSAHVKWQRWGGAEGKRLPEE